MGGLLGDLESLWNSVATTGQTVFHDLEDAVNQLTSLGVPVFPDMKAFIQLLVTEGENPFTFLPNLVGHITSRGGNVVSTLEELANGFLQEGPHNYVSRQTSKVINPIINIVQQHTQTATALGSLHQSTVTQIQTKLTTLSQGSPGTIPFQGQAALSIQNNFTTAATNLNTLAAPMNATTTSTSSGLSDPWSTFQDNFASINQTFVSGLQDIPNMTRQFVLFDLGVLAVELIIGGAVALPTVGLGDAVEVPIAGVVDVVILAAELLTVAVWFVGDCLVWAICVIAALAALGIEEIIYHIQLATSAAASSSGGGHVLSPGERNQAVNDAWNNIDKELGNLGKSMGDLIKIVGSAAAVKKMIEMLVCMGYSTAEITSLLTSMVTNTALTVPYTLPPGASGVTVTGSDTLMDLFNKLFEANLTGDVKTYQATARLLKAIMDIGPQNIAGIDVQFQNPPGSSVGNSDADIITKNGDIYEIGGSDKIRKFASQDMADKEFIDQGGTGNTGGDIHLWMDANSKDVNTAQSWYETGTKPNPGDPQDYGKYLSNPNFKKPADVTQKIPPSWVCGSGYVVK